MPLRNAKPLSWRPKGLSDAVDGTNSFAGAMEVLSNLIPDPSTGSTFVPRPAAVALETFATLAKPAQVSCGFIQNDIFYGLIGSSVAPGYDQPFAFDLDSRELLPVAGVTAFNVPVTQPLSGDWQPPIMASLSTYIMVAHPGFTGFSNGFFGYFDVTVPELPVWHSGNISIYPLFSPPTSVFSFGGRMYYAVGNATVASDEFLPLQSTNANQVLTYGDNTPITALAGLPLNNELGGIIQSLMVFKQAKVIYQLTGDYTGTPSAWAINTLNVATGTLAPNTLCTTSRGLAFVAPDGLRIIDFSGNVGDPIGNNGQGVTIPFKNAVAPTRMCAAFNLNVLRITVQNGAVSAQQFQEYWFDFNLKIWTGPHSFPVALILPWQNTFIAANPIVAGK